MIARNAFLSIAFWLLSTSLAYGQGAFDADMERLDACLSYYSHDPEQCFGHVSTLCRMDGFENAPNPVRGGMWCDYRAMDAWRQTADAAFDELTLGLPAGLADELRQHQELSQEGRRHSCWYPSHHVGQPMRLVLEAEQARCVLRQEQERALHLLSILSFFRAGDFEQ